jgi:hypothetical protein
MVVILWFWATVWDEPYRLETPGLQGMRRCLQPLRPGELSFPAGIPLDKSNNNNSNVSNNNSDDKSNHINNNSDWNSNSTFFFLWNLFFFAGDLWNCHVEGRWFSSRFFLPSMRMLVNKWCGFQWSTVLVLHASFVYSRFEFPKVSWHLIEHFSLLWLVALSSQQILWELETNLSSFLSTSHD